jgi:polyvinyl alcohol dehydrogenase (cytochrome)
MWRDISRVTAILVLIGSGIVAAAEQQNSADTETETLYRQRCAGCHDEGVSRAPARESLGQMSPENVRFALTSGKMLLQGTSLTQEQIIALSRFLTGKDAQPPLPAAAFCDSHHVSFEGAFARPHWNGWGVDLSQSRSQPAKMAQLPSGQLQKLKVKWAFGFPGDFRAYAQPAVLSGQLFVGSAGRKVYSLNADTGCIDWTFDADFPVRTAISVGQGQRGWAAYFGDQHANAYAVDAADGKLLWKVRPEEHPEAIITGTPTLADGKLYVPISSNEESVGANPTYPCCKFRGSISALDAVTGKILWKSYTISDEAKPVGKNKQGLQLWGPSGAAVWSSPTVDLKRHKIYVTTGNGYSDPPAKTSDAFLAFDADTGKLEWSRQITAGDASTIDCTLEPALRTNCPQSNGPDSDFGSSPILVELPHHRRALIAGDKSGVVSAVDPDHQGAILWQRRVGQGGTAGGVMWGAAADESHVYVAVSDVRMSVVSEGTAGARRSIFGPPRALDPKAGGGLFALRLDTGEITWHTPHPGCGEKPGCSPAQSAAVTLIPGAVFSGGLDGHLRAYSTDDGRIIWDIDTEQEYKTVNGVKANGGSLDGPGPVVVGGVLYVNSGYGFFGTAAGNVLLAFSVNGK